MGKGGVTGEVAFPGYMENIHREFFDIPQTRGGGNDEMPLITRSVPGLLNSRIGQPHANPYHMAHEASLSDRRRPFDPSTEITSFKDNFNDGLKAILDSLDDEVKWQNVVDVVIAKLDASGSLNNIDVATSIADSFGDAGNLIHKAAVAAQDEINLDTLQPLIDAYEQQISYNKASSVSAFKGIMSDANSVHSSSFVIGLALIEAQALADVDRFSSEQYEVHYRTFVQQYVGAYVESVRVRIQSRTLEKTIRDQLLAQGIQGLTGLFVNRMQSEYQAAIVGAEIGRVSSILQVEHNSTEIDRDVKRATWDMNVWTWGANMLSAPTGPTFLPEGNSTAASVLGGAMIGAGQGAMVGSAVPGVGTLLGAGVGALLGAGTGLL